jgi:hypothetical protein
MAARNKDVHREWIVFGSHCCKFALDIKYRRSESFQCVLKACRTHAVQPNISDGERQIGTVRRTTARLSEFPGPHSPRRVKEVFTQWRKP